MSLHLARLLRFKNLAFNIFVFVIISGVEAMAFGTDERSSSSSSNENDDSPDYERQRSVLLVFDEVSCIRKAWWHLPPQWKWDVNGGPRGRIYSNPEDFPGEEYADFTPEKRVSVGRGIQGEVRRRLCNGRVLACKKTSIDPAHRIVSQESMKEVESLKKLSHQHISQLVGIFIHDNDLYSLSYPVAEMDLKGYLDLNRTLNPTWVNSLIEGMGCLSNALAYAHAAGVKHRDIHCGNIVIIGGTMILIDWGMSSDSSGQTVSQISRGISDGDRLRISDVAQLGVVFEKILAHVDHDLRTSNFERDPPKRRPEFRQTMSAAAKTITRNDFHSLFRVMMENDKIRSPSALDVADYLRLGKFERAFRFFEQGDDGQVFCKTCGDCCV